MKPGQVAVARPMQLSGKDWRYDLVILAAVVLTLLPSMLVRPTPDGLFAYRTLLGTRGGDDEGLRMKRMCKVSREEVKG